MTCTHTVYEEKIKYIKKIRVKGEEFMRKWESIIEERFKGEEFMREWESIIEG